MRPKTVVKCIRKLIQKRHVIIFKFPDLDLYLKEEELNFIPNKTQLPPLLTVSDCLIGCSLSMLYIQSSKGL